MDSGLVSASLIPEIVRALSRTRKSSGMLGCANKRAMSKIACCLSVADASVRTDKPLRSVPGPPPRCAAISAKASEICASVSAGSSIPLGDLAARIPRPNILLVSAATPDFPFGSRLAPASNSTLTSSIGIL